MRHSPDVPVSRQEIIPDAELTRLVQALMVLPSEQREELLQILETTSSFEALQAALKAHSDLRSALERYSIDIHVSLSSEPKSGQKASFVPTNLQASFQSAVMATIRYCWTNNRDALEEAVAIWEYILHHPDFP